MNNLKTRILFIAQSATLAHVIRSLRLIELLDLNRNEVFVATEKKFHSLFLHLNIEMLDLDSSEMAEFRIRIAKGLTPFSASSIKKQVAEDIRIIDYVHPQIIFGDLRNSLSISARIKGIFYVNINNAYWSPQVCLNPSFGLLARFLLRIGCWIVILPYRKILKHVRLSFTDYREFYIDGDRTLFFDSPELVPLKSLTSRQHFCGPLIWSNDCKLPDWWTQLNPKKKWVFVGLGSSGQHQDLPVIVRALLEINVEVVVASDEKFPEILSHPGVYIADAFPLDKILSSFELVICNGGSPTSYLALNHGIPVLGIVSNRDQILAMSHIQAKGAGLLLQHRSLNGQEIFKAVEKILSKPEFRQRAKAIQISFSKFNLQKELNQILNEIINS